MTYKQILRYAEVITKNPEIARDVVHDFYITLHKKGKNLLDGSLPKNFIFKGLKYTAIDYFKKYYSYQANYEKNWITTTDVYEMGIELDQISPLQYCTSQNILESCLKNISIGYWDTYHHNFIGSNLKHKIRYSNPSHRQMFIDIFNYYALGYTTSDIAKMFEMSEQHINYYKYLIKKWIQPILKG